MVILFGVLGFCVGSFINALVWRLHEQGAGAPAGRKKKRDKKLSIINGRSMCPDCKHELAWYDLVPVASWVLLGGRCRYCRKPISIQYPAVEILTAGLFILSYLQLAPQGMVGWLSFAVWLFALASLIALSIYDLRWMLLPDVILVPLMVVATVWLVVLLALGAPHQVLVGPLVAAFAVGGSFYLLAAVSKGRWMGGGDIKLVFAMGLLLGLQRMAVAMFFGFVSAAIVGIVLLSLRLRKRSELIPFGPFLVAGTIVAMLYGPTVIEAYLRASGLNMLL